MPTADLSGIDWSFGWCNSRRTPLITVPKNVFYHQHSNDGQNGKTLKHDLKKLCSPQIKVLTEFW